MLKFLGCIIVTSSCTLLSEADEALTRIETVRGVEGAAIINAEGVPIHTTFNQESTAQYSALLTQLVNKARGTVRDIDPTNDLTFLRIHSKKNEILVAPDKQHLLVVVQSVAESQPKK